MADGMSRAVGLQIDQEDDHRKSEGQRQAARSLRPWTRGVLIIAHYWGRNGCDVADDLAQCAIAAQALMDMQTARSPGNPVISTFDDVIASHRTRSAINIGSCPSRLTGSRRAANSYFASFTSLSPACSRRTVSSSSV